MIWKNSFNICIFLSESQHLHEHVKVKQAFAYLLYVFQQRLEHPRSSEPSPQSSIPSHTQDHFIQESVAQRN